MNSFNTICQQIALLKELKEHHENIVETLGRDIQKLSAEAYKGFTDANMESLVISSDLFKDGQSRIIRPDTKYATSVVQPAKFFGWLRSRNLGDIIKETIHPKTLESFVSKQKEDNQPLPAEDVLKVFTVETVSIRRAPKAAKQKESASNV